MDWDGLDALIEEKMTEGSAQVEVFSSVIADHIESGYSGGGSVALAGLVTLSLALTDLYSAVQGLHIQLDGLRAGLIELAGYEEGNDESGD